MFLHLKSEVFRKEIGDVIVKLDEIIGFEMASGKRNDVFTCCIKYETKDHNYVEHFKTEENARNRLKTVLGMLSPNDTVKNIESMANDVLIRNHCEEKKESKDSDEPSMREKLSVLSSLRDIMEKVSNK